MFVPATLSEIECQITEWLKWCRRHRREGIVLKCYKNQVMSKEKIDLPRNPKLDKPQKSQVRYPAMPEEKILRVLQRAYDELGSDEAWHDKAKAMPVIVKHFQTEAREHLYSVPVNMYSIYISYNITLVRSGGETGQKNINSTAGIL